MGSIPWTKIKLIYHLYSKHDSTSDKLTESAVKQNYELLIIILFYFLQVVRAKNKIRVDELR